MTCDQARHGGVEEGSGGDVQVHPGILLGTGVERLSIDVLVCHDVLYAVLGCGGVVQNWLQT